MSATDAANDKNTHEAHSNAASLHRIAAEKSKLIGDMDTHAVHADMAKQHEDAAGRSRAAAENKVAPALNSEKVLAKNAAELKACEESKRECPNCHKEVDTDKLEGAETGSVICPHCKNKFHPSSEAKPAEAKTADVVIAKLNELSAKRMSLKAPLMAALGGYSLNDLQQDIRDQCSDLKQLTESKSGNMSLVS